MKEALEKSPDYELFEFIEANDKVSPASAPYGSIQWKGTGVCIDLYCACGKQSHFDGEFFYFFRCPYCKAVYGVGQKVTLVPLDPERAKVAEASGCGISTPEIDEEDPGA